MKKICVIGSLNVDMTIRLPRFHEPGETIIAEAFNLYAGGKGGNQAVAASLLGANVLMVGKLGADSNGDFYRDVLAKNHVDAAGVETAASVPSGVAMIEVDAAGENRIAIVQGANGLVDRAQVDRLMPLLQQYDIFLFQFEVPIDTVRYAAERMRAQGKTVILDPAPAAPLPEGLLDSVNYLTPNENELALLSGLPTQGSEQVVEAARFLIRQGAHAVLAKLGQRGSLYVDAREVHEIPGFRVRVVDTTAAGDSFNAGFAWALAQEKPILEAMRVANAVGALSTTAAGAQQAMPDMRQVELLLRAQAGHSTSC
jgi:ribokinase